jgi:hypothetical protein
MERKQHCHEQASPSGPGNPSQHQEKKGSIEQMQEHAGKVVAYWLQPKQLAVQCMREPGKRVPVVFFGGSQRPTEGVTSQALLDMAILSDISPIVVVDERIFGGAIVDRERRHHEQNADGEI